MLLIDFFFTNDQKVSLSIRCIISILLLAGICHAYMQVVNKVWMPWQSYLPEILAIIVLPASCLFIGLRLVRLLSSDELSYVIFFYILGSLSYSVISVLISHVPWWNFEQVFYHVLRVPWGESIFMSTRAVEQRAFFAIALTPVLLIKNKARNLNTKILKSIVTFMVALGLYVRYSTASNIGYAVLYLSLIPLIVNACHYRLLKWGITCLYLLIPFAAFFSKKVCDERFSLQGTFLKNMLAAPWGGRSLSFAYKSCIEGEKLTFGSSTAASTFTPHSALLDIYNDSGMIPFILFSIATLLILDKIVKIFLKIKMTAQPTIHFYLRWSLLSVFIVQYLAQPLLYTDQLMFNISFAFAGIAISE